MAANILSNPKGAKSWGAAAILAALSTTGCEATFHPGEPMSATISYDASEMEPARVVPRDIWDHPRVFYGGTYAYLVNGRWYFPTNRGWMVFRREPIELSRQRTYLGRAPSRGPSCDCPPPTDGFPR